MRVAEFYSHLHGYEYLRFRHQSIWEEINQVIFEVNAEACRTKVSGEKRMLGRMLFDPKALNREFARRMSALGWAERRTHYYVTSNARLARGTLTLPAPEQRRAIEAAGGTAIYSYNQTDFVKSRIAVEVQFGKYAFVAYDLFVKHMAFYVQDQIDLGIEMLPMKSLQSEMSSGPAYYEGEVYNVIRQGRNTPAVPLIIIGIEP